MEKRAASAPKRVLKFLPKAASAINFHSLPFSPGRDKRSENTHKHKAIVGRGANPIRSMIPVEVRRQPTNESFETQEEPTSPKISCMGQIKHKRKMNKATYKHISPPQDTKPVSQAPNQVKKQASKLKRLFTGSKAGRKSNASDGDKPTVPDRAPSLSQMKRFASGRDTLASFDWTGHQIAPMRSDHRDCYSDEERDDGFGEEDEDDEEVIIPFSAPIMVGGGVDLLPRKEVNIWKRRTMNPPRPLQLRSNLLQRKATFQSISRTIVLNLCSLLYRGTKTLPSKYPKTGERDEEGQRTSFLWVLAM
ncbi:unnamed protein product [Dovyalis caffra]|uniref:Syringolide-induced protein 14-1-1 n=1 Tax=Dovyalis caffra TaxID=77055 RepID=A0AAV1S5B1_9ROSI|nr:unnamed protein product [Dovyalis caffra]